MMLHEYNYTSYMNSRSFNLRDCSYSRKQVCQQLPFYVTWFAKLLYKIYRVGWSKIPHVQRAIIKHNIYTKNLYI